MPVERVIIEGQEYDWSDLCEEAQRLIESLRFVDQKISEFETEVKIFKLAKSNYLKSLKEVMEKE